MKKVLQPKIKTANKKGEPGISQKNLQLFRNTTKKKIEANDENEAKEVQNPKARDSKSKIDGKQKSNMSMLFAKKSVMLKA